MLDIQGPFSHSSLILDRCLHGPIPCCGSSPKSIKGKGRVGIGRDCRSPGNRFVLQLEPVAQTSVPLNRAGVTG